VDGEVGERVNVKIIADGGEDTLSDVTEAYPRTQLPADSGTVPPTERLHYYIFDKGDVFNVPVVVARFSGQLEPWKLGFASKGNVVEALAQWERAREYDINTYMGSDRGASGSIGFDLEYYDNEGEFYTVKERSHYAGKDDGFATNFAEDAKEEADPDSSPWIATHLSGTDNAVAGKPLGLFTKERIYAPMGSNPNNESSGHYGTWIHELSHLYLGMGDLYSDGDVVGGLEHPIMAEGYGCPRNYEVGYCPAAQRYEKGGLSPSLPSSYSALSKTYLNDLGGSDNNDPEWPWANTNEVKIGTDGATVDVERVNKIGLEDTVPVLNTNKTGSNGSIKYLFEGHVYENSVRGYKITEAGILKQLDTAVTVDESVDGQKSYVSDGLFTEFSVDTSTSPFEVTASYTSESESTTTALSQSVDSYVGSSLLSGTPAPNATTPDLDLRAVDSEGRITGVNEDGEYVNEIPGAEASGDTNGVEWITVPDDADVEFEVSSDDVEEFIEETDATEENVSVNYSTSVTSYGSDTEVVTENGEPTVTNTTTKVVTENKSIDPGTTENAVDETVIAGFSQTPNQPSPGDSVKFNGSLSTDLNGEIASYEWDFGGDGTTDATGQTASRSYSSTGDYTVELTVTGDDGTTDTTIQTISVGSTGSLSPDNPFGNDNNEPLGELKVVQRLVSWNEDGQIDGQGYGELELIQYLVEWNEAS
jgi:chitodextrinase